MKFSCRGVSLSALLLGMSVSAFGQANVQSEDKRPWRASSELGITDTSGNTTGTLAKLKTDFEYDAQMFRTTVNFDLLYKTDEKDKTVVDPDTNENIKVTEKNTTAHKYNIAVQSNYKVTQKNQAIFARVSYDKDRFSSFDYQATLTFGYNTRLLRSDESFLDLSMGPGMAFDATFQNELNEETGQNEKVKVSDSYFQLYSAAKYERKLSDTAYFTQRLSVEGNLEDNTKTVSDTAITSKINGSLALKASIKFIHNSTVKDGFDKTDTVTGATLVYTF
ncbi:DUF481 domain-containing protein [Algibacillus agarilyticus]|uniref:DUF481 domain-containing protein n=1 Tax=Algibacillus agarilyticus TaxID=2234133 RepID=UPI00130031BD|nr:DUF481 domain-containing protein [Algibacillus agarilyticus]